MPRLIDAVSLSEKIRQLARWGNSRIDILSLVTNEPTINTVEVVFCKECKFIESENTWYCWRRQNIVNEDDYCSWGERREDETN